MGLSDFPHPYIAHHLQNRALCFAAHAGSMFKRSGIHAKAKLISKTLLALLCGEIRGK